MAYQKTEAEKIGTHSDVLSASEKDELNTRCTLPQ